MNFINYLEMQKLQYVNN